MDGFITVCSSSIQNRKVDNLKPGHHLAHALKQIAQIDKAEAIDELIKHDKQKDELETSLPGSIHVPIGRKDGRRRNTKSLRDKSKRNR